MKENNLLMLGVVLCILWLIFFCIYIVPSIYHQSQYNKFCESAYPSEISFDDNILGTISGVAPGHIECCKKIINEDHRLEEQCKVFKYNIS